MFKIISDKEQLFHERRRNELLAARQKEAALAASIAFVALAEAGNVDGVTAAEHTALFAPWAPAVTYSPGALRRYGEGLYRCVQAHTAQSRWKPDETPALWVKVGEPADPFPQWSRPIGAKDVYGLGDQVTNKGTRWRATAADNVWEPGVFGWTAVQ